MVYKIMLLFLSTNVRAEEVFGVSEQAVSIGVSSVLVFLAAFLLKEHWENKMKAFCFSGFFLWLAFSWQMFLSKTQAPLLETFNELFIFF